MWKGRNLSLPQDRRVLVVRSFEPQRLDHFVAKSLGWKSRSRLQQIIREGAIKVNDSASKPSRKVRHGDVVTLELSNGAGMPADYEELHLKIIYEDLWLVAVSKPPGMLVHPVGRHVYDTLINYLHRRYRGASEAEAPNTGWRGASWRNTGFRGRSTEQGTGDRPVVPRLCHRIDRDTTGAVLVAKEETVHREIMWQFENRKMVKEYLALVHGAFPHERTSLSTPIGEGRSLRTCLEHEVLKPSHTDIGVLKRFAGFTLLSCAPKTGRQNQIRVHLAASGHPLVGDERFGGGEAPPGFPGRFLLHSRSLKFYHPRLKSQVELVAPLPDDFATVLEGLSR